MIILSEEYNPVSGMTMRTIFRNDGAIVVQCLQDVEPHLDQNRRELNMKSAKASRLGRDGGLGVKVASIPMGIVEMLAQQKGLNVITCSDEELKKLLNSPEYSKLRTSHGRL